MADYYQVLGLEQGATPQQVKKAYFTLVRQYSPEENPDKFREIREAYEQLQKPQEEQGPVFPELSDPTARDILQKIHKSQEQGDVSVTKAICEKARDMFPEVTQFLFLLAIAQRRAGNTGKAVKSCEQLVKEEPENKWFWRELAISYMERGFTKKAFGAFEKGYELGCRDSDFVLTFSVECRDYRQYDKAAEVLSEMIHRDKRWERDELPELFEAYTGLFTLERKVAFINKQDIMDNLCRFMQKYSVYLEENLYEICSMLASLGMAGRLEGEQFRQVERAVTILERTCKKPESRELLAMVKRRFLVMRIQGDSRLGKTLKECANSLFLSESDGEIGRFGMLDAKLCMIEEQEEILPQLAIVRQEYPEFYEWIREFADQLQSGKSLEYLKSSLLKQYVRMSEYMPKCNYFDKYPKQREACFGKAVTVNPLKPYVKDGKKIGRNDPCPCGSGKKYKYCCGRN